MNKEAQFIPSVPQARKNFHDWLDNNRPWANSKDAYEIMEQIVDAAGYAFRGDVRVKREEVSEMERNLLRFTQDLKEHPDNYDGPCACEECRSA